MQFIDSNHGSILCGNTIALLWWINKALEVVCPMRDVIKCREYKHIDLSRAGHGPLVPFGLLEMSALNSLKVPNWPSVSTLVLRVCWWPHTHCWACICQVLSVYGKLFWKTLSRHTLRTHAVSLVHRVKNDRTSLTLLSPYAETTNLTSYILYLF